MPRRLTDKQRRYLFAVGILGSKNGKIYVKDKKRYEAFKSKMGGGGGGKVGKGDDKSDSVTPSRSKKALIKGAKIGLLGGSIYAGLKVGKALGAKKFIASSVLAIGLLSTVGHGIKKRRREQKEKAVFGRTLNNQERNGIALAYRRNPERLTASARGLGGKSKSDRLKWLSKTVDQEKKFLRQEKSVEIAAKNLRKQGKRVRINSKKYPDLAKRFNKE